MLFCFQGTKQPAVFKGTLVETTARRMAQRKTPGTEVPGVAKLSQYSTN
jgi:hypothetical protein